MKINVISSLRVIARTALSTVLLSAALFSSAHADAPINGWSNNRAPGVFSYASASAACAGLIPPATAGAVSGNFAPCLNSSGTAVSTAARSPTANLCLAGGSPDTSKPLAQQCATASTTCNGYDTPELAASQGYYSLQNPVCTWDDPATKFKSTCTGTYQGKQTTENLVCKNTGNSADTPGINPKPIPVPPPPVEVDWPDCPAGTFGYIDVQAGTSSCSVPEPTNNPNDPANCTSGNVGTVNGNLVCLPSNPAPAVAQAAADSAQAKANEAKATPGTQSAIDAAKQASIDAQKAVDAANSKPDDASAQANAKRAIEAARQASGHAGVPYNGPAGTGAGAGTGNGTGVGTGGNGNSDTGPRECGTPGRPKCQIDETGTPTNGDASIKVGKDALDAAVTAHTQALDQVTSGDGKDTSWGWMPSVPHSTCTPIQFANLGTLDWCATAPAIEEVMSWLWSLTAVIFVIAMTSSTIKGN